MPQNTNYIGNYSSSQAVNGMLALGYSVGSSEFGTNPIAIIDSSGNITTPAGTTITTPVLLATDQINLGALAGLAGSLVFDGVTKTAITDATATSVVTISVTNVNASFVLRVLNRSSTSAAAHIYDSTRVVEYLVTGTRVAGANLVGGISAAIGAQIASVSAGRTLTSTLALSAVTGGVTAINTIDIQVTNTSSVVGVSDCTLIYELYTVGAGVTIAAS